jgi:hypothetical protein
MARQACISIGIDRYQFFQPLSFASADARSIQSFCTDEAGWNQEQCLLMTDNSTALHDHSTLPNRLWREHQWRRIPVADRCGSPKN